MRRFMISAVLLLPVVAYGAWDSSAVHDRGPQLITGSLTVRGGPVRGDELVAGDAGVAFPDGTRQRSAERLPRLTTGAVVLEGADAGITFADGTRQRSAERLPRLTTGAVVLEGADAGITFADGTRQGSAALPKTGGTLTGDLVLATGAGIAFPDGTRQASAASSPLDTANTLDFKIRKKDDANVMLRIYGEDYDSNLKEIFRLYRSGWLSFAAGAQKIITSEGQTGEPIIIQPYSSNLASATLLAVQSKTQLTVKNSSLQSWSSSTSSPVARISHVGAFEFGKITSEAPAQPYACDTDSEGETLYRRDTDAGESVWGELCLCARNGATSFSWRVVGTGEACF